MYTVSLLIQIINMFLICYMYTITFHVSGRVEQVSTKSMRGHLHKSEQKPTRVRTVLNEKQLHTLRTCYNANPRPDALMKEQLVEMTGLSPRVIRVWFQNKRCKDKKRSIMMKQIQQQQQEKVSICTWVKISIVFVYIYICSTTYHILKEFKDHLCVLRL